TCRERVLARDFLLVVVGNRRSLVDLAEAVDHTGVREHCRGELCFPGTGVTDEGDVSDSGGVVDLHGSGPLCGGKTASYLPRLTRRKVRYSYRRASMGSRRDALNAGYRPKKMPTEAEKPRPMANDHHGIETEKPDTRCTRPPMPLPSAIPRTPPSEVRNAASIRN